MTATDLAAILPLLVLAATVLVVMTAIAVRRHHGTTVTLTLLGMAAALATLPWAAAAAPRSVTPLLVVDRFALFYEGLIVAGAIVTVALSYGYLRGRDDHPEEFYLLVTLATLGSAVLVSSSHFASLFLGLETLSVSLYGLVAYRRGSRRSTEAGLKYLLLAAASSAFLLFGIALVYADSGTLELGRLAALAGGGDLRPSWLLAGFALILVGAGFKLAAVPFHMWTGDVYQGAPAPVTGFIATVSKGGMLALLLRYFAVLDLRAYGPMLVVLSVLAAASMFGGNLLALLQTNVKRVLAYSSVAHMGYMLVAFVAAGALAMEAVTFYLVAYFVTTLAAFGVIAVISGKEGDSDEIDDFRGLFWRRPTLAALFAATLFSLAGIPLTAGFVGKYLVAAAGVGAALWALVVILVVNSAISVYYYLRVIIAMYSATPDGAPAPALASMSLLGGLALAGLALLLLWLGVLPSTFIDAIAPAVHALV